MKYSLLIGAVAVVLTGVLGVFATDLTSIATEAGPAEIKRVVNLNVATLNANGLVTGAVAVERGGALSVADTTTITQAFTAVYIDVPDLLFTVSGLTVTNAITVASNQFTVVMGTSNTTYKYMAVGATE